MRESVVRLEKHEAFILEGGGCAGSEGNNDRG